MTPQDADGQTIKQVILDYYHAGHVKADPALYAEALHPDWRFSLIREDALALIDRDEYMSWYKPEEANPDLNWETEFYSVDVTGPIAAVKLRLSCEDVCYIDYFHLLKLDGRWWIIHKISTPC